MMDKVPSVGRPAPIPASPHLKRAMIVIGQDDEPSLGDKKPWPPRKHVPWTQRPHGFLAKCASEGGKRVAWPPHLDANEHADDDGHGDEAAPDAPHGAHPHQNEDTPHIGSPPYPCGFKLREEPPMEHVVTPPVVPAQPTFKITQPVHFKADTKWPPKKYCGGLDAITSQVREFLRPSKGSHGNTELFAQDDLPNNYPGYRVPPGTQHHGLV